MMARRSSPSSADASPLEAAPCGVGSTASMCLWRRRRRVDAASSFRGSAGSTGTRHQQGMSAMPPRSYCTPMPAPVEALSHIPGGNFGGSCFNPIPESCSPRAQAGGEALRVGLSSARRAFCHESSFSKGNRKLSFHNMSTSCIAPPPPGSSKVAVWPPIARPISEAQCAGVQPARSQSKWSEAPAGSARRSPSESTPVTTSLQFAGTPPLAALSATLKGWSF
mmetsp:Transcript_133525/g.386505  ORF Transcript_133525/g.386505 Transcript_133525/m.386505 type:complete len:223 (+) Transcript_133525:572-1240(+)